MVSPPQQRKRDPPKIVPPRSPLPARRRALHPGAPDMVRPRRSHAQVAAEKKQAEGRKHDAKKLAQRNIDTLAQMGIQQKIDDEEEEARVIEKLSDIEMVENPETKSDSAGSTSAKEDSEYHGGDGGGGDGYGGDTEPVSGADLGDDGSASSSDMEVVPAQDAPVKANVSWFPNIFSYPRVLMRIHREGGGLEKEKC
jgi:hypothetical protein